MTGLVLGVARLGGSLSVEEGQVKVICVQLVSLQADREGRS